MKYMAPAPKRKVVRKKVARAPARTTIPRAPRHRAPAGPASKKFSFENVGSEAGSWLGAKLGQLASYVTGFGDYRVEGNSIMDTINQVPSIINSNNSGGTIIRHREYISDIAATTGFSVTALRINPGLKSSFPWLASTANSFEQFRIRGMIYEFRSLSSDAVLSSATSSALGAVIMATDYNANASQFNTKQAMEAYEFSNSSKPSLNFIHPIECKSSLTSISNLYIRNSQEGTGDNRLYDMGLFQIATTGMQASGGIIGELWCTYEIELFKPRLGGQGATDHFELVAGIANATPLGTSSTAFPNNSINGTLSAGTTYSFPSAVSSGRFMIVWSVLGTVSGTGTLVYPIISGVNCAVIAFWDNYTASQLNGSSVVATTYERMFITAVIQIATSTASFSLGTAGTLPAGVSNIGDLCVTEMNPFSS